MVQVVIAARGNSGYIVEAVEVATVVEVLVVVDLVIVVVVVFIIVYQYIFSPECCVD